MTDAGGKRGAGLSIREAVPADATAMCAIYNHYVEHTVISFEEEPVSAELMAERIRDLGPGYPWLVCVEGGRIVGYAYAGRWRARSAYARSVESTVYVRADAVGRGIGTVLYRGLLERLRGGGFHAVMAGISLPNDASVALHEKLGFRKVAHFREVGYKLGKWVDVGFWQIVFPEGG